MNLVVDNSIVEFVEEKAGIYFRSLRMPRAGTVVSQHVHDHDHATLCGNGRAIMFVNGERVGELRAGQAAELKAGQRHSFITLKPDTLLVCIHDVASAESIKRKGL